MAAHTTNDLSPAYGAHEDAKAGAAPCRPRLTGRKAGRALKTLGHAIEYLADEYVSDNSSPSAKGGTLEAIQTLMALNREIYLSYPKLPTVMQRLRSLMGRR